MELVFNYYRNYYRARYYNATVQRFISEDPLGSAGGDVNFYVYAGNDPVDFIDPLGLDKNRDKCPSPFMQSLYSSMIGSNPMTYAAYLEALGLSNLTGGTTIVGVGGNVGASIWPEEALGGSAGGSLGIAVDPSGNVGLAVSGRVGGGFNGGTGVSYSGGGTIRSTRQPSICGLNGGSLGGSISGGPVSGSVTVSAVLAGGLGTFGGVSSTTVFPLVCR